MNKADLVVPEPTPQCRRHPRRHNFVGGAKVAVRAMIQCITEVKPWRQRQLSQQYEKFLFGQSRKFLF
jgi:hypothetical protein